MAAREITAVTDFILASEVFLLAGMLLARRKAVGSAAWFWTLAMLLMATAALLAGIDHGFLEPRGEIVRDPLLRSCRLVIGVMAACMFVTGALEFTPRRVARVLMIVAGVQLAVYAVLVFVWNNYLVVILDYAPAMLLLLILNVYALPAGRGSWSMLAGVLLFIAASILQATGVGFGLLDKNGLYHLGAMTGAVFLYRGGTALTGFADR